MTALAGRVRPVWALYLFVAGLALHNFAMAELWDAGVRGTALDVVSAWKEVVLLLALVLVVLARGRFPFDGAPTDWLAVAYGAFVVVYALIPQSALDGTATQHGVLLGVRHDLVPVAAYFLGRGLDLTTRDLRRIGAVVVATGAAVAAFGLVDIYTIPLSWWRDSGAPGWFRDQLGFVYTGLSGLPQNFVYNTGNEQPLRRLVSTFLSPLATSYLLIVALLVCTAWLVRLSPRGWRLALWAGSVLLLLAGLLWTHSRSAYIGLALGLFAFAWARRADGTRTVVGVAGAAVAVLVLGVAFVEAYPHIAPTTSFTPAELVVQRANAATGGPAITGAEDASLRSHWSSLRGGIRTVVHHPQGFGVGNAGSTAARTHVAIRAGESTYTELGVDVGLVGGLVFVAWSLALAWSALRCSAWIGGSLVAVLALAVQTDVIGVPWLAYVLWALAGATVRRADL
jgi:hypothetical protein